MENQLSFWDAYPLLKNELIKVNKIVNKEINRVNGDVGKALIDAFSIEGKLLRPALVLLFAQYDKCDKEHLKKIINIAAAVELLHNATLIHDDIIDGADMRRGHPSIQAKYGKRIAVYAGDLLFALSSRLLSDNSRSLKSLQFNGEIMQGILGGELTQLDHSYNIEITKEQYLTQINGKTGLLFGLSCFLGTFESKNTNKLAKKADTFGELLGQAFQIKDDILDYTKEEKDINKPVLLDVKNGIYSGPIIFSLQKDKSHELKNLLAKKDNLTNEELVQIKSLVNKLGGIEASNKLAEDLLVKATKIINTKFNHFSTKTTILELSQFLLNRTY